MFGGKCQATFGRSFEGLRWMLGGKSEVNLGKNKACVGRKLNRSECIQNATPQLARLIIDKMIHLQGVVNKIHTKSRLCPNGQSRIPASSGLAGDLDTVGGLNT